MIFTLQLLNGNGKGIKASEHSKKYALMCWQVDFTIKQKAGDPTASTLHMGEHYFAVYISSYSECQLQLSKEELET